MNFLWHAQSLCISHYSLLNTSSFPRLIIVIGAVGPQEKNNGFPFLDILGYLKNTHTNSKVGKVRQVPTREFPTKFPDWDLSDSSKFGIFLGIL